ncbi:MAG: FAD-binding oxidoreductase [Acidimicrobiia bacterium]|nr:FAD-binding oxidoreductase [Acidimicrobiia bacterium]
MMGDWKTRSFWLEQGDYTPGERLDGDETADVVIVGGGFTGLWSAICLKEADPSIEVTVLEQKVVGFGASGRNGGFAMTIVGRNIHQLAKMVGDTRAGATYRAMHTAIGEIEDFATSEAIEADIWRSGNLTVSNGPEQDVRIRQDLDAAERMGLPFTPLDADQVQAYAHSPTFRIGHFEDQALILDPAALSRGLADAARRRGVRILELTPVDAVEDIGGLRVEARTPFGTVHADRAVIATNAYAHSIPELRRFIFTIYAYITLTEPLTAEQWERIGWESRCGIEDKRILVHFSRRTADGRILWGGRDAPFMSGGPNERHDRNQRLFDRLEETFRWTFPGLDDVAMDRGWAGPVCGTVDCIASVNWLRGQRILYALGYAGHGVGPSRLVGKIVRDMLLTDGTELTALPFVAKKPVPLPPGRVLRRLLLDTSHKVLIGVDENPERADRALGRFALRVLQ